MQCEKHFSYIHTATWKKFQGNQLLHLYNSKDDRSTSISTSIFIFFFLSCSIMLMVKLFFLFYFFLDKDQNCIFTWVKHLEKLCFDPKLCNMLKIHRNWKTTRSIHFLKQLGNWKEWAEINSYKTKDPSSSEWIAERKLRDYRLIDHVFYLKVESRGNLSRK